MQRSPIRISYYSLRFRQFLRIKITHAISNTAGSTYEMTIGTTEDFLYPILARSRDNAPVRIAGRQKPPIITLPIPINISSRIHPDEDITCMQIYRNINAPIDIFIAEKTELIIYAVFIMTPPGLYEIIITYFINFPRCQM